MALTSCIDVLSVSRYGTAVSCGEMWGEWLVCPVKDLLVMMPQKSCPRPSLDMDLNAKFLLLISFQVPWSDRSGFSCILYFVFVVVVIVFHFFVCWFVFLFRVGGLPDTLLGMHRI